VTTNSCEDYLHDVLASLLATAREAKADLASIRAQASTDAGAFEAGRAQAYYEVCSLLVSQLAVFRIERNRVGVSESLDVDDMLL